MLTQPLLPGLTLVLTLAWQIIFRLSCFPSPKELRFFFFFKYMAVVFYPEATVSLVRLYLIQVSILA